MKRKNVSVIFSTSLSKEAKEALTLFCQGRGFKINQFLEEIIWDRLEDEMDAEIARDSGHEELIDLKEIIGRRK